MSAVTLTYGTNTITLRPPEFDNVQSISLDRIARKTRNGDLIIFRDPNWVKNEVFKYSFVYLTQRQVYDLLNFIQLSLGQNVTLVDYEGRIFVGTIINPAAVMAQPGVDNFTVDIEFQVNQNQIATYGA